MDLDPQKLNLAGIFSNERIRLYEIPNYQREYTWGKNEWGDLFDDVTENDREYYLGSIICVKRDDKAFEDFTKLEIIDGQQRITSLSILLTAIYSQLSNYKNDFDDDENVDFVNLRRQIVYVDKQKIQTPRLKLQDQNDNQADYKALLGENGIYNFSDRKNNAGNRRIYRAYNYFIDSIEKHIENEKSKNQDKLPKDILFCLLEKINSILIISIEVKTSKDAYMLFSSLNNRGIPLSAVDLIKNELIRNSDKDNKSNDCYEQWKKIIRNLKDDTVIEERFFRQYYNAFINDLNIPFIKTENNKTYPLGAIATKSNTFGIYERLLECDYKSTIDNIEEKSKLYAILINNSEQEKVYKQSLLNLERIQGTPSYILLLFILAKQQSLDLGDEHISSIISFLVKFFVRRNFTDTPSTRDLSRIFMNLNKQIEKKHGDEILKIIFETLKSTTASDDLFREKLCGSVYDDNKDATRFLLCYYEERFKTKEINRYLWEKDSKDKYKWTIEHIFPEGKNIPLHWINEIANGDNELAQEYYNKYVHTLGNLTITGYNSNLSNKPFLEKRNYKSKNGNYIGYKNGLKLNEDVACHDKWTVDLIEKRTEKLVSYFLEEFKL